MTTNMATLTVREQKVVNKPTRYQTTETVKTFGPKALRSAGTANGGTVLNKPKAPAGRKANYRRVSTARPVLGPLGTKSRTIVN